MGHNENSLMGFSRGLSITGVDKLLRGILGVQTTAHVQLVCLLSCQARVETRSKRQRTLCPKFRGLGDYGVLRGIMLLPRAASLLNTLEYLVMSGSAE